MDRSAVEVMSQVAGILAKTKGVVAEKVRPEDLELYMEIRDFLCDCLELMAVHCDCAPIRLIAGQVDEIMENKNYALHQHG
jgi:hypothetical protein